MFFRYFIALYVTASFVEFIEGTCLCWSGPRLKASTRAANNSVEDVTLKTGKCYEYAGFKRTKDGLRWFKLWNKNQQVWVTGKHWIKGPASSCGDAVKGVACKRNMFVSRADWGARPPKSKEYLASPVDMVFIHHTAGPSCNSTEQCKRIVKGIQNYHMDTRGYADIGYSFLVGEDGMVYEGRGWNVVGAHTYKFNTRSLGFSMIGNFMTRLPNQAALDAVRSAIQCGVDKGYITGDYRLYGHREAPGAATDCPGNALLALIKTWPHHP